MELLPENREVLDGYRRARPEALETVYRAYVREVAAFLRKGFLFNSKGRRLAFTGYSNPEDLRDALQETFLLAFGEGARLGYNGLLPFSKYLLGIARNVVLDRFRKDMSRLICFRELDDDYVSPKEALAQQPSPILPCPSPEQEAAKREIREAVESFIGELSEEQRQLVRLYFMEGQSQESTASAMSIDRNRVRKQIRFIRLKLWKKLKREGLDRALPFSMKYLEFKP